MPFPVHRLRRLRRTEGLRGLVRETRITPDAMVYPIFVGP
ncbi:MAG TPA: porphobilinogen synthase, partial [Terriglobia bacterium]|nr:porphobilinogen synthase [Terriglobia bacterium]